MHGPRLRRDKYVLPSCPRPANVPWDEDGLPVLCATDRLSRFIYRRRSLLNREGRGLERRERAVQDCLGASPLSPRGSRMSNPDDEKASYETLGLPPDATMDQVRSRYRELNDAYLRILQSKRGAKASPTGRPAPAADDAVRPRGEPDARPKQGSTPRQQTHTEPIARIKARLAKGEIDKAQFEKLAKERYDHLKNKPFIDLTDSEFEERLHGFEGLKFL